MSLLSVESLDVFYGDVQAVRKVSFAVEEGEVVTLIGANGAGKSTTLRAVAGLLAPRAGRVVFDGEDVTGRPANELASRRHRPRARRPAALAGHDGPREPPDGRVPEARP